MHAHRAVLRHLLLAAAMLVPAARAPATERAPAWQDVVLPEARQLDVTSRTTGHGYRIFVAAPAGPAPATGHPLLVVLDGNAAFPVAAFLARSAAARSEVTGHAPPVVVGIGYPGARDFDVPARKRDYTPGRPDAPATEGGAASFLDFIEQEVKPLVASRHSIDPQRQALFGHSFGGLFVLHALFSRPDSFSTFIASSPSIWWQDKLVLDGLPRYEKLDPARRPRVQISVGALEDAPRKGNYSPETLALIASRPMVPEARALARRLQQAPGAEGRVAFHELAGEDHGPAWLPAMTRGMQFFLQQPASP